VKSREFKIHNLRNTNSCCVSIDFLDFGILLQYDFQDQLYEITLVNTPDIPFDDEDLYTVNLSIPYIPEVLPEEYHLTDLDLYYEESWL